MGKINILKIDSKPLTFAGKLAGICYGQTNEKRFPSIARYCMDSNHGRVFESISVTFEFDEYSAKVIRELFRHKAGTTELQASTRYIDYSTGIFGYVTPKSIRSIPKAEEIFHRHMIATRTAMNEMKELGVPVEDFTNVLPLAYETKGIYSINLRALIHMFGVRSCACAYWEFRDLMRDIKKAIVATQDEEWIEIVNNYLVPKCEQIGYCDEDKRYCGRSLLKKSDIKKGDK